MLLESQVLANPAAGGLLCSCNGRGTRMFAESGHDIELARRVMPGTPMAGFFAAGELGPVGGKNFLHGHTASLALFRPADSI
jgi:small ligand-binding sensory domain FIST